MARALLQRGRWHFVRHELDEADATTRRAVGLLESEGPSAQWLLAAALRHLASIASADGREQEAVGLHTRARALELYEGAVDLQASRSAPGNAALGEGIARMEAGDLDGATPLLLSALTHLEHERGPLSVDVASAHVTLAKLYDARGDVPAASFHARRADQILREAHGVAHPARVFVLSSLGTMEFRQGRFTEAVDQYERALRLAVLQPDATPSDLAIHRANLGEALYRDGRLPLAAQVLERAVADLEHELGRDDAQVAIPSKALGEVLMAQGDILAARPRLEHALTLLIRHGINDVEQAEARFALAKALLASGEPAKAIEMARVAASELAVLGPSGAARERDLREWLNSNDTNRSTKQ